jgi:hypothetical protein
MNFEVYNRKLLLINKNKKLEWLSTIKKNMSKMMEALIFFIERSYKCTTICYVMSSFTLSKDIFYYEKNMTCYFHWSLLMVSNLILFLYYNFRFAFQKI